MQTLRIRSKGSQPSIKCQNETELNEVNGVC